MKVAVLGAAHGHVLDALGEVGKREDLQLVAVAEPDEAMRERFLHDQPVPVYASVDELVDRHQFDVAIVAGIYGQRGEAVLAALSANAHVFADKPLCTTLGHVEQIDAAAKKFGRHVSVMFTKRFTPATIAAERLINHGVLGDLALVASTGPHKLTQRSRPDWFFDRRDYGGIAADLPAHDIDLVLHLTGATSGTVSAMTGNARPVDHPDFDDHVAMLLHTNTVLATIEASWLAPEAALVPGHYRMRLTGSLGTAEIDWAHNSLTVATHDRATWTEPLSDTRSVYARYFDSLLAGQSPEITTTAALAATKISLLAQQSADEGGTQISWTI